MTCQPCTQQCQTLACHRCSGFPLVATRDEKAIRFVLGCARRTRVKVAVAVLRLVAGTEAPNEDGIPALPISTRHHRRVATSTWEDGVSFAHTTGAAHGGKIIG